MKKVLVITYYWPPAGGPGVQRWLKFVTYLEEFGITPVLYVPANAKYPLLDPTMIREVPSDITIYKYNISEPLQWARGLFKKKAERISSGIISESKPGWMESLLLWIRGNFFIPDARVLWVKPSVRFLEEKIASEEIDTLVTTGPPHSMHLIGLRLKERSGINWVADFRDPWTSIGYHDKLKLGPVARRKHKELEAAVLKGADKVLVTSRTTKREFESITSRPVVVVTNGYEESAYSGQPVALDDAFTITHTGSLLSGRNPEALWRALQEMVAENELFRKAFRLRLAGVVSHEVQASMDRHGLLPFLEEMEYQTHDETVQLQRQSQVLLLIETDSLETEGILPGKLFEYLAAQRPVLAVGPGSWEAGAIIRETGAGSVFDYDSGAGIRKQLLEWFELYSKGGLKTASRGIEKYGRRAITRQLAKELVWE